MEIKEVMQKAVHALLNSGSYNDLSEEQNAVVVEFETELWKPKVDELRKSMSPEEIKETIHDWWSDYEIANGTEDNLLAYSELCKNNNTPCFRQEEIDKVCQAIIDSPVDISRELQDRVLNILQNNSY